MAARSREWLRAFLWLGARGDSEVMPRDILRQEDSVLRALDLLDRSPGVVLADEVGMGKTYEALGIVAARLHARPEARTLVLTPGPDLNTKWRKEISAFGDPERPMFAGFRGRFVEAWSLADVVRGFREAVLVIAPNSIFTSGSTRLDRSYLLSLWAEHAGLAGNQVAAIFRRYRDGGAERVACESENLYGVFGWEAVRPVAGSALRAHARSGRVSLSALLREHGYDGFADTKAVDAALRDIRFRLMNLLLPMLDLLVVDEAHKLKNPYSIRSEGVRTTFEGRFEKALFLTATPFQLSVEELAQVFSLFGRARSAPTSFPARADRLLVGVREYQKAYDEFLRAWGHVDFAMAAEFALLFNRDPDLSMEPDDPALRRIVALARNLLSLKRLKIEPGFRAWMIRSLREDKRSYRNAERHLIRPGGGDGAPFLIYERFIAEIFRQKERTHKAAVQINMVSSYGAARTGALLADEDRRDSAQSVEDYRRLLQRVVGKLQRQHGGHPKVRHVVRNAVSAAEVGDKTLVFCTRIETLRELRREIRVEWESWIVGRWQRVYPGALPSDIFDETEDETRVRGRHSRLQLRFQRPQDLLYLALRERHVQTSLGAGAFVEALLDEIVKRANEILASQEVSPTQARRIDWRMLARCVEQATALALQARGESAAGDADSLRRLVHPDYVRLGFGLRLGDRAGLARGPARPRWKISPEEVRFVVGADHLWARLRPELGELPNELRARAVERVALYLVSRHVPFLAELLEGARDAGVDVDSIESRALLTVVDGFWSSERGMQWIERLRVFLLYVSRLDDARRRGQWVRARHGREGES